jgi:hypothetical protein
MSSPIVHEHKIDATLYEEKYEAESQLQKENEQTECTYFSNYGSCRNMSNCHFKHVAIDYVMVHNACPDFEKDGYCAKMKNGCIHEHYEEEDRGLCPNYDPKTGKCDDELCPNMPCFKSRFVLRLNGVPVQCKNGVFCKYYNCYFYHPQGKLNPTRVYKYVPRYNPKVKKSWLSNLFK